MRRTEDEAFCVEAPSRRATVVVASATSRARTSALAPTHLISLRSTRCSPSSAARPAHGEGDPAHGERFEGRPQHHEGFLVSVELKEHLPQQRRRTRRGFVLALRGACLDRPPAARLRPHPDAGRASASQRPRALEEPDPLQRLLWAMTAAFIMGALPVLAGRRATQRARRRAPDHTAPSTPTLGGLGAVQDRPARAVAVMWGDDLRGLRPGRYRGHTRGTRADDQCRSPRLAARRASRMRAAGQAPAESRSGRT